MAGTAEVRKRHRFAGHETTADIRTAIAREKQNWGRLRSRKIALIKSMNPDWQDLSAAWTDG